MNIDSIRNYSAGVMLKHKPKYGLENGAENKSADVCDKKNVNRGYYSGSFTGGRNGAAADVFENLGKSTWDKISGSKKFEKLREIFRTQGPIGAGLVSLVAAGVLRPATNLATTGKKDREDGIYAASHAISSAVIGFIVASIVMAPFGSAYKKISSNPEKYLKGLEKLFGVESIGKRRLEKSKAYKKLSDIAKFAMDSIVLGIPKAMLTIALIPPILKYVFHMEKGKKKDAAPIQQPTQDYSKNLVNSPVFKEVQGGKE